MALPDNISRQNILDAIQKYENDGMPRGYKPSHTYDVKYDDKSYPPPAIIALAVEAATGTLPKPGFPVGKGAKSFKILEQNGFVIVNKRERPE